MTECALICFFLLILIKEFNMRFFWLLWVHYGYILIFVRDFRNAGRRQCMVLVEKKYHSLHRVKAI